MQRAELQNFISVAYLLLKKRFNSPQYIDFRSNNMLAIIRGLLCPIFNKILAPELRKFVFALPQGPSCLLKWTPKIRLDNSYLIFLSIFTTSTVSIY